MAEVSCNSPGKPTKQTPRPNGFGSLPPEVRQEIYRYAISEDPDIVPLRCIRRRYTSGSGYVYERAERCIDGLLLANHQIHSEAKSAYYRHKVFGVDFSDKRLDFIRHPDLQWDMCKLWDFEGTNLDFRLDLYLVQNCQITIHLPLKMSSFRLAADRLCDGYNRDIDGRLTPVRESRSHKGLGSSIKRLKIRFISTWLYSMSPCCGRDFDAGAGWVEWQPPFPSGYHNKYQYSDGKRQLKEMMEYLTKKMPDLLDVKIAFSGKKTGPNTELEHIYYCPRGIIEAGVEDALMTSGRLWGQGRYGGP